MRWPMSSQCWWVIVGDCCDRQHHFGRCSGSKKSLDTWTVPSPHWCAVFCHYHFSPRSHMFSSTSWCNLAPSFHEYESVAHQLLQKWHHHSLPPFQKSAPSPPLCQHYLVSTSFFITAATKHPILLNSMISRRTQNTESSTNALPDPQIGLVILYNKPQVAPSLSLYSGLPNSFDWSSPSTNYIPNKIPDKPQHIVWYSFPNGQAFLGRNINPGKV